MSINSSGMSLQQQCEMLDKRQNDSKEVSEHAYVYDVNMLCEDESKWRGQHQYAKKQCHIDDCILMSHNEWCLHKKHTYCLYILQYQQQNIYRLTLRRPRKEFVLLYSCKH